MSDLFGRTCTLTLGTTQIKCVQVTSSADAEQNGGLAIVFQVKKNLKPEPNQVEIKVWNLSQFTRLLIEQPKLVPVQLDVGYGGDNHTIYIGQLRSATSEITGSNIITSISSGDSEQAFAAQRVKFVVPPQAPPQSTFMTAAQGLGVGLGNVAQMLGNVTATTGGPGRAIMGNAAKVFSQMTRANGLQWSVQDGALQVMPIGQAVGSPASAVVLSSKTGLIGSPTVDNKGIVKCEALIQPGLTPGLPIVINSVNLGGTYRVEDVEYNGATWGAPWTATIHARKWK